MSAGPYKDYFIHLSYLDFTNHSFVNARLSLGKSFVSNLGILYRTSPFPLVFAMPKIVEKPKEHLYSFNKSIVSSL
ncbi:hypothetical protein D3C86_2196360 [compost metagenome]